MDERTRRLRIQLLLGAHIAVGSVTAVIGAKAGQYDWPFVVDLVYAAFLATEVLLLGMWVGLGGGRWWTRLCSLITGIGWLCILTIASVGTGNLRQELPEIAMILTLCTIGVAGALILGRRLFGRLQRRDEWPHTNDFQFNMKSLLWFTALIGMLLTMGGTVRRWGGDNMGVVVVGLVFALEAMLVAWLLAFAGLGFGRNLIRVTLTLAGVALFGLLPPYYLGGPTSRFAAWVALTVVTAVLTLASLFVVRSCGYRLVQFQTATEKATPVT